jgi:hypothetical protein
MQTLDHDHVSVHIDTPTEAVYTLVADVTGPPNRPGDPALHLAGRRHRPGRRGPVRCSEQGLPGPGVEEPPGRHRRAAGSRVRLRAHRETLGHPRLAVPARAVRGSVTVHARSPYPHSRTEHARW